VSFEAESDIVQDPASRTSAQSVAGFLAAVSIFVSFAGIFWHPLRLILPSLVIALVAAGMSDHNRRLAQAAVLIGAACLFLGLTVAVATSHALW
jgi:hypothetical protein